MRLSTAEMLPYSWEVLNHYLPFFVPVYMQKPGGIIFLDEWLLLLKENIEVSIASVCS